MTGGALKAPNLLAVTANQPYIAPDRCSSDLDARSQIFALHDGSNRSTENLGVFTMARRGQGDVPGRYWHERSVSVSAALTVDVGDPDSEMFVSQQSFWRRRSISELKYLGAAYVDIDYRQRARWRDSSPETVLWALMRVLSDQNVPTPSYVVSTGNGLCVVWLHSYIPRSALARWTAVQSSLANALADFGADRNALDAARMFRVVGSRNVRARDWRYETVRSLFSKAPVQLLRHPDHQYQFDDFAHEVLPIGRNDLVLLSVERAKRRAERSLVNSSKPTTLLTTATYYEAVLTDLQRLRRHRHGDTGCLPPGQRDEWLFIAACAIGHLSPPSVLPREITVLAAEAGGWTDRETRARMSSVLSRALRAGRGDTLVDLNGDPVDPRYRFKAATIVERLAISSTEMEGAGLRVLVDRDRQRAINTERTRASRHRRGAVPRADAREARRELGLRAVLHQKQEGLTLRRIAELEGVSVFQVSKAIRELAE